MRQIKIIDDVVVSVVFSYLKLDNYIENNDLIVVVGSVKNADGTFTPPTYNLEEQKQNLQQKLQQSAKRTVELLNLKYELTNNLGMAQVMKNEYVSYSLDSTVPTPTIDEWAEAKGRTREEQLARVGGVVAFTKFSAIIMEQFYSKTDKATTEAEIVEIETILAELNEYDDLSEVMVKRDEFLRRIRDVGV